MTVRHWVFQTLVSLPLADFFGGIKTPRVFAKKTMTSSIESHLFAVYKLGYNANENVSETVDISRQFIQIWVHDYSDGDSGDYGRIDEAIRAIKKRFHLATDKANGVIQCTYLETSQDLSDETLNTVMKYIRFQVATKETS